MFKDLKNKLSTRWSELLRMDGTLLIAETPKNHLFNLYLENLPAEIRQEHTCNACRHFVNTYGGIQVIKNAKTHTLWLGNQ